MNLPKLKYVKLTGYNYRLAEDYSIKTDIRLEEDIFFPNKENPFVSLTTNGILTLHKGYAIDGATNAFDTDTILKAAFVHDGGYQLMRRGKLPLRYKPYFDKFFIEICRLSGMSWFRAKYVALALDLFGEIAASPTDEKDLQEKVFEI